MNPLKDFDNIHADRALKEKTLHNVMSKKTHPISKRLILTCVLAFVCMFSFIFYKNIHDTSTNKPVVKVAAYVSLDVNPSIEIQIDKNDQVIKTIAYNNDARILLKEVDLKGKTINEALSILVSNSSYNDDIQNGFLEASVYANDRKITRRIYQILNNTLKNNLNIDQYHCAQINKEQHSNAKSHHISGGKYRLIEQIQTFDSSYGVNELNQLNVRELYEILNRFDPNIVPRSCGGLQNSMHEQHRNHR